VILNAGRPGHGDRANQPAIDMQWNAASERHEIRPGDHPVEELGLFAEVLAEVAAELQRGLPGQDDRLRLVHGGPGGQAGGAVHAHEVAVIDGRGGW
jgi:hypothetical protein